MVIFLLLSIPLWFFFLNTFFQNEGIRKRDFLIPLGKGAVIYVISLLFTWLFTNQLTLGDVTFMGVFFYDFRFYNGLIVSLWLVLYFLFRLLGGNDRQAYPIREIILMLSALYLCDSIYRILIRESWYGLYELFLLPLDNMGQIILLALILVRWDGAVPLHKILLFFLSLGTVLVYSIVPALFTYNYPLPGLITGILFFVVAFFLFLKELSGDIPGSSIRYIKRES